MFMRVDQLQASLPVPDREDPNAAAALQELLGGKIRRDVHSRQLHVPTPL